MHWRHLTTKRGVAYLHSQEPRGEKGLISSYFTLLSWPLNVKIVDYRPTVWNPIMYSFLCYVCIVDGAISTLGSHLHQHNGPIHPVHSSLSPHPSRGQPCRRKLKRLLHRGFAFTVPSPACDALWLISFHLQADHPIPKSSSWFHYPESFFRETFCLRLSWIRDWKKGIWSSFYILLLLVQHLFNIFLYLSHDLNYKALIKV